MMGGWQQAPSGLYVPAPAPEPPQSPQPEPDVKFRPPREDETAGIFGGKFEQYLVAMTGRPCPKCGNPVDQGDRHEYMCLFFCGCCRWWARVTAGGLVETMDRKSGRRVKFRVKETRR